MNRAFASNCGDRRRSRYSTEQRQQIEKALSSGGTLFKDRGFRNNGGVISEHVLRTMNVDIRINYNGEKYESPSEALSGALSYVGANAPSLSGRTLLLNLPKLLGPIVRGGAYDDFNIDENNVTFENDASDETLGMIRILLSSDVTLRHFIATMFRSLPQQEILLHTGSGSECSTDEQLSPLNKCTLLLKIELERGFIRLTKKVKIACAAGHWMPQEGKSYICISATKDTSSFFWFPPPRPTEASATIDQSPSSRPRNSDAMDESSNAVSIAEESPVAKDSELQMFMTPELVSQSDGKSPPAKDSELQMFMTPEQVSQSDEEPPPALQGNTVSNDGDCLQTSPHGTRSCRSSTRLAQSDGEPIISPRPTEASATIDQSPSSRPRNSDAMDESSNAVSIAEESPVAKDSESEMFMTPELVSQSDGKSPPAKDSELQMFMTPEQVSQSDEEPPPALQGNTVSNDGDCLQTSPHGTRSCRYSTRLAQSDGEPIISPRPTEASATIDQSPSSRPRNSDAMDESSNAVSIAEESPVAKDSESEMFMTPELVSQSDEEPPPPALQGNTVSNDGDYLQTSPHSTRSCRSSTRLAQSDGEPIISSNQGGVSILQNDCSTDFEEEQSESGYTPETDDATHTKDNGRDSLFVNQLETSSSNRSSSSTTVSYHEQYELDGQHFRIFNALGEGNCLLHCILRDNGIEGIEPLKRDLLQHIKSHRDWYEEKFGVDVLDDLTAKLSLPNNPGGFNADTLLCVVANMRGNTYVLVDDTTHPVTFRYDRFELFDEENAENRGRTTQYILRRNNHFDRLEPFELNNDRSSSSVPLGLEVEFGDLQLSSAAAASNQTTTSSSASSLSPTQLFGTSIANETGISMTRDSSDRSELEVVLEELDQSNDSLSIPQSRDDTALQSFVGSSSEDSGSTDYPLPSSSSVTSSEANSIITIIDSSSSESSQSSVSIISISSSSESSQSNLSVHQSAAASNNNLPSSLGLPQSRVESNEVVQLVIGNNLGTYIYQKSLFPSDLSEVMEDSYCMSIQGRITREHFVYELMVQGAKSINSKLPCIIVQSENNLIYLNDSQGIQCGEDLEIFRGASNEYRSRWHQETEEQGCRWKCIVFGNEAILNSWNKRLLRHQAHLKKREKFHVMDCKELHRLGGFIHIWREAINNVHGVDKVALLNGLDVAIFFSYETGGVGFVHGNIVINGRATRSLRGDTNKFQAQFHDNPDELLPGFTIGDIALGHLVYNSLMNKFNDDGFYKIGHSSEYKDIVGKALKCLQNTE